MSLKMMGRLDITFIWFIKPKKQFGLFPKKGPGKNGLIAAACRH